VIELDFPSYEVVSFDIFDTLVHRRVLAPVDVFELVRLRAFEDKRSLLHHNLLSNYVNGRIQAESVARSRRVEEFSGEGEVTLDEIYSQFQKSTDCPPALVQWLKELEISSERGVLYQSAYGKKLYDQAVASNCSVVFISDMYLPSSFLQEVLVSLGFLGARDIPIFVSGETRLSKHSGALYNYVSEQLGVECTSAWLHVGDNVHSDIHMAQRVGLTAYHAQWSSVVNVLTVNESSRGCGSFAQSLVASVRTPQYEPRLPEDPLERIGYQVWGPMFFGFGCWLVGEFRNRRADRIVYIARDGWFISKLVDLLTDQIPEWRISSSYFLMSRKSGFKTGIRDWHSERTWYFAAGKSTLCARKIFDAAGIDAQAHRSVLQRFGVWDIDEALSPDAVGNAVRALNSLFSEALRQSASNRGALSAYYDHTLKLGSRVAIVDIGWVGNIQRLFLHSLSDPVASERVFGLYLGLHRDHVRLNAELGMFMQSWIGSFDQYERFNKVLLSGGVELLEFVLTAPYGSVVDLVLQEEDVVPVLEDRGDEEKDYQALSARVQAGVLRFFADHVFLLDWLSPSTIANEAWAAEFLRLASDPSDEELRHLATLTHSDGPGMNDGRKVLAPSLKSAAARDLKEWEKARDDAYWKPAFEKLNPKPV
jgi:predicted HAD superfamily hydrolase